MTIRQLALITLTPAATALLVATAGAQVRPAPATAATASTSEPPTVLPTIIGVRRHSANKSKTASSPIPYPTTITAAGPVYSTETGELDPTAEPAPVAGSGIIEVPFGVSFYGDYVRYGRARLRNRWNDGRFDSRHRQDGWRERQGRQWDGLERNGRDRVGPTSGRRRAPTPIGVPAQRRVH